MRFTRLFLGGVALLVLALAIVAVPTSAMTTNDNQDITAITAPPMTHGPPMTALAAMDNTLASDMLNQGVVKTFAPADNTATAWRSVLGTNEISGDVATISDSLVTLDSDVTTATQQTTAINNTGDSVDNYPNPFNAFETPDISAAPATAMLGQNSPATTTNTDGSTFAGVNKVTDYRHPGEGSAPKLAA